MDELKRCQCGEMPTLKTRHYIAFGTGKEYPKETHPFQILCKCGMQTKTFDIEQEARNCWNRRADGWIPVTERLPEETMLVLCKSDKGVHEALCSGQDGKFFYFGDRIHATHWMPLPQPPKEETV